MECATPSPYRTLEDYKIGVRNLRFLTPKELNESEETSEPEAETAQWRSIDWIFTCCHVNKALFAAFLACAFFFRYGLYSITISLFFDCTGKVLWSNNETVGNGGGCWSRKGGIVLIHLSNLYLSKA
jgi:hypothetical protein